MWIGRMGMKAKVKEGRRKERERKEKEKKNERELSYHCPNREGWAQVDRNDEGDSGCSSYPRQW